jgi:MFS family permease
VKAPWRMLALIAVGEVLGMTLWFSATAAGPAIGAEYRMDAAARAWLTMAVQGGFVVGTLLTAITSLADAINARRLFAAGCVLGAVFNASITAAPSSATIIVLRFCTGMSLAWVYPPGMKIAAGWFLDRRGTALGIVVGAVGLGSAFPHLLAWAGAGLPWRSLVGASSILAIAAAAVVISRVTDGPYVSASAPFDRHALDVVLRSRGTRLAMFGYFGHMWELYAMWTWMAAWAAASLVQPAGSRVGSLIAFVTIAAGAVGCVVAGNWADEWGKARVAGAAMIGSAACCLVTPFVFGATSAVLFGLAIVWGFTVVADSAQFSALVTDYTPRTHVGTALTLQTSAGFLLTMVSMRLVPPVSEMAGWRWAFVFLAPGPILGAMAMWRLNRIRFSA